MIVINWQTLFINADEILKTILLINQYDKIQP